MIKIKGALIMLRVKVVEYPEWAKFHFLDNKIHRVGGAAIEYFNGTKAYYQNGKRHRVGGAAVEYPNGAKYYYYEDKRHRVDGAAIEYTNGAKAYFIHGDEVSVEVYKFYLKKRRRFMLKYWLKWTAWIMDPHTDRGKRYIERNYQRMLKECREHNKMNNQ